MSLQAALWRSQSIALPARLDSESKQSPDRSPPQISNPQSPITNHNFLIPYYLVTQSLIPYSLLPYPPIWGRSGWGPLLHIFILHLTPFIGYGILLFARSRGVAV